MDEQSRDCKEVSVGSAITYIGEFGRYQKIVEGIICFVIFFIGFHHYLMYLCTITPSWSCVSSSTSCHGNETRGRDDMTRCKIPRDQWYFTEQKKYSIVTWFDLSCDEQWMIGTISSAFYIGSSVGSIILGIAGDVFGRRFVLLPSAFMLVLFSALTVMMPKIHYIIICRFFVGFFYSGAMVQGIILLGEIVGPSFRSLAIILPFIFFPIGWCVLAIKAYFLRDWRMLCLACTVPYFIIFLFLCNFIPESPAWLVEKGRVEEAEEELERMAKYNKIDVSSGFIQLSPLMQSADAIGPTTTPEISRNFIFSTLIQLSLWGSTTLAFFGLNFASDKLPGNLYTNFSLLSLVEVPSIVIAIKCCDWFGRKVTTLLSCFLAGLICLVLAHMSNLIGLGTSKVVLGVIGKFFVCIPFQSLYVWSSELFPTRYRAQSVGLMDSSSRLSAAVAPLLAASHSVSKWTLFIVLGVPILVSSTVGLWLAETRIKKDEPINKSSLMKDASSNQKIMLLLYKYYYRLNNSGSKS